tara:strand:- start:33999 stop:34781 length:783 start_codon:yes stop_codon:yes gene_type:complete
MNEAVQFFTHTLVFLGLLIRFLLRRDEAETFPRNRVRSKIQLDIERYAECSEEWLMSDAPTTRHSLLLRMRDAGDDEAWHTFVELYAPLVYRYARKRGLQDADAADLTQDVLRSIADAMKRGTYDVGKGSFHAWLFTVTRNAVFKDLRAGQRQPSGSGDTRMQVQLEQIEESGERDTWENEYRQRLFAWACNDVRCEFREHTWQAFWMAAVEGKSIQDVSTQLGMSAGSIYVAKSRILTRIKDRIEQADGDLPSDNDKYQ